MSQPHRLKSLVWSLVLALTSAPMLVNAALPGAQAPTRGEGTNMMQTFQNYAYDGFMLLGLVLIGGAMIGVAHHAYGTYHEIHEGKKKWRDLGLTGVVGACLIGIAIYMVTKATTVL